ncbi:MAG: toxin HicA [Chloroflexota bacterium]|nr:MAG: toxin HicA [Chloroflexota bacterium]
MNKRKILAHALAGSKNISFSDMIALVEAFGFRLSRIKGSHHIFTHPRVNELVNLQNVHGKAKPYQIRQFLKLVEQNNLQMEDGE